MFYFSECEAKPFTYNKGSDIFSNVGISAKGFLFFLKKFQVISHLFQK